MHGIEIKIKTTKIKEEIIFMAGKKDLYLDANFIIDLYGRQVANEARDSLSLYF